MLKRRMEVLAMLFLFASCSLNIDNRQEPEEAENGGDVTALKRNNIPVLREKVQAVFTFGNPQEVGL
jgi:hypothetical protein